MIHTLNRRRQEIVRMMIKRVKLKYTPDSSFISMNLSKKAIIFSRFSASSNATKTLPKNEPPQPTTRPFDGILLVDKPTGWTSHDVVAKVRGHFRLNKVGHGGTLDPMATGLLVLLIGRATKCSSAIMDGDKTYSGTIQLGRTTTTQDIEGEILTELDPSAVTEEQIKNALLAFTGEIQQLPPWSLPSKKMA